MKKIKITAYILLLSIFGFTYIFEAFIWIYIRNTIAFIFISLALFDILNIMVKSVIFKYEPKNRMLVTIEIMKVIVFAVLIVLLSNFQLTYINYLSSPTKNGFQYYDRYNHLIYETIGDAYIDVEVIINLDNYLEVEFSYSKDIFNVSFQSLEGVIYDHVDYHFTNIINTKIYYQDANITQFEISNVMYTMANAEDTTISFISKTIKNGDYSRSDIDYFLLSRLSDSITVEASNYDDLLSYDLSLIELPQESYQETSYQLDEIQNNLQSSYQLTKIANNSQEFIYDIFVNENSLSIYDIRPSISYEKFSEVTKEDSNIYIHTENNYLNDSRSYQHDYTYSLINGLPLLDHRDGEVFENQTSLYEITTYYIKTKISQMDLYQYITYNSDESFRSESFQEVLTKDDLTTIELYHFNDKSLIDFVMNNPNQNNDSFLISNDLYDIQEDIFDDPYFFVPYNVMVYQEPVYISRIYSKIS